MIELKAGYQPKTLEQEQQEFKQKHQQELSKLHDLIDELRVRIIQEQTAADRAKDYANYLSKKYQGLQELEKAYKLAASSQHPDCVACRLTNKYFSPESN